nr:hypothetical protein [Tanacetum cinerariifolium]
MDLESVIDQGLMIEDGNALEDLKASLPAYKYLRISHNPQFPLNYKYEPGYIENYNSYPYDSSSFPEQYPCCEDCGVTHEAYHCQPPQYTVNHPIFNAHNDLLSSQTMLNEQMTQLTSMCEMACQFVQKKLEEKRIEEEQAAKAKNSKIPACSDDDDDYNSAITPNEPVDSLSMGDELLDTIPATESDEFINYCVENLVPNPNVPEKVFLNPLFEEEINSMRIDQHNFNAESDLIESLLNRDSSIFSSSLKIDSLLNEFAGELALLKSILPRIDKTDCHPENEIRLIERLFDFRMEEIDLTFTPDDLVPPSIEDDDNDSERDILIVEELPSNYSLSLPEIDNDKNSSEIQLEHEKEDELVVVVVKVVHELDCRMVVKEIKDGLLEKIKRSLDGALSKTLMIRDDWDLRRTIIAIVSTVLTQLTRLCEELLPGSRLATNGSRRALATLKLSLDGPKESWRILFSTQDANGSSLNFSRRRAHP